MSTKPMKPLPKAQVKVDLTQAETMKCEYCENYLFISSTIIKRLSGADSTSYDLDKVNSDSYGCEKFGTGELRLLCRLNS